MSDANTSPVELKDGITIQNGLEIKHLGWATVAITGWDWVKNKVSGLDKGKSLWWIAAVTIVMLVVFLFTHGTTKKVPVPSKATKTIEETMSSRSIKILGVEELALINDFRASKSMLPLERSGWLEDEAVRLASEMTTLKDNVRVNPLNLSDDVKGRFGEVARVLAVGQKSLDQVINDWVKDKTLVGIIASGRYDLAGLAYVEDTKSHWKHHWVLVLAKSKTERS